MTSEEARSVVRAVLHEVAPDADLDNVGPDATLQESLGLDSLDFLAFVDRLHERTGIAIFERDYTRLLTIDDCAAFLVSATGRGQSPT